MRAGLWRFSWIQNLECLAHTFRRIPTSDICTFLTHWPGRFRRTKCRCAGKVSRRLNLAGVVSHHERHVRWDSARSSTWVDRKTFVQKTEKWLLVFQSTYQIHCSSDPFSVIVFLDVGLRGDVSGPLHEPLGVALRDTGLVVCVGVQQQPTPRSIRRPSCSKTMEHSRWHSARRM